MKAKNLDFLVYVHGTLCLWFLLFAGSLFIRDGGQIASVLAIGNVLFLLANIPLGIFSLMEKDRFSLKCRKPAVILSIINLVIGVAIWVFVILLLQTP